jgi:hypothetical protein
MYVHTLLFLCPACNQPSAASFVRYEHNPEGVDAQVIYLDCERCMTCSEVFAFSAKRRWVMEMDEELSARWPAVGKTAEPTKQ